MKVRKEEFPEIKNYYRYQMRVEEAKKNLHHALLACPVYANGESEKIARQAKNLLDEIEFMD